jgi:hypothetical protein
MSEGFAGSGAGGDGDRDAEQLHDVMALATTHIGAVVADRARLRSAQRRHRMAEGGVAAGVLSVALVAATVAMYGGGGAGKAPVVGGPAPTKVSQNPTTVPSAAKVITPVGVSVYDSDDGSEGNGSAKQLLEGTGAWQTNQYCQDYATSEGLPKSTGLIFDLGAATRFGDVTVSVGIPGANLEMWTADESNTASPGIRPHQPPAGFTKAAGAADTGTTVVLSPAHTVTTRYVLVWFTRTLPAVPNPDASIHCAHSDGHLYGDSITAVRFARG